MIQPDLLPRIRGEFLNLSEPILSALKVAASPFEVVDEDKRLGFKLFRYRHTKPTENCILLIPHIINRPYILDLNGDVSVVRRFCERGFDVYLIDWGYPSAEHRDISFLDYSQYVDAALSFIAREDVSILGYCTGGIISLIYASLHPERVKGIALLATPVDFSVWHDPRILWGKVFDARKVAFFFGNIPGELVNTIGFYLLMLYMPLFSRSLEFVDEFLTYESWRDMWRRVRWLVDTQAVPASAYIEFIEGCYQENLLIRNKLKVGSHLIDLRRIDCPLLNILAKYDHIVPIESSKALKEVYSGENYQEIVFPSSHVGLSVSRKAHKDLWPKVCEWFEANSKAVKTKTADEVARRGISSND